MGEIFKIHGTQRLRGAVLMGVLAAGVLAAGKAAASCPNGMIMQRDARGQDFCASEAYIRTRNLERQVLLRSGSYGAYLKQRADDQRSLTENEQAKQRKFQSDLQAEKKRRVRGFN